MSKSLYELQESILDQLHAGEPVDAEALLQQHPEHAESLGRFLSLVQEIESPAGRDQPGPGPSKLGEFKVLREVGRGGMGVVYEAEQASLKRRVALKVLPVAHATNRTVVARFRREAEAAGRLRHPNIVPVYSVGESNSVPFFAMELVEGKALSELIEQRVAMRETGGGGGEVAWRARVIEMAALLADALHYAHGQGILHRDVKPANVLLEKDGVPRLTDFGLALDLTAPGLTATGEMFGTPRYMSPEQVIQRNTPIDQRTDVYSLGVTLYEALTLRSPYEGATTSDILSALHSGRLVAPRKVDPSIPHDLEKVVLRALQQDPGARYPTAAAFAQDLRAVATRRPIAPRPRRPLLRAWSGRRWLGIAAAVLILVLASWWVGRGRGDVPTGPFSAAELLAIADGESEHGNESLSAWIRPHVGARHFVLTSTGSDATSYDVRIDPGAQRHARRARPEEDVLLVAYWELAVGGGAWRELGFSATTTSDGAADLQVGYADLADRWREAGSPPALSVHHRARVRVLPRPAGFGTGRLGMADCWAMPAGAAATWTDTREIRFVDAYPAHYPHAITGEEVDDAMRRSVEFLSCRPVQRGAKSGGRSHPEPEWFFMLRLSGLAPEGPLPLACAIDLLDPKSNEVVGTASWVRPAASIATRHLRARDEGRPEPIHLYRGFDVSKEIYEDGAVWSRLVSADRLQFVFRGSRAAARESGEIERYWGGSHTVTVPVADK